MCQEFEVKNDPLFKPMLNLGTFSNYYSNLASLMSCRGDVQFFLFFKSKLEVIVANYNFIFILNPLLRNYSYNYDFNKKKL